jgi:hypothetical protein
MLRETSEDHATWWDGGVHRLTGEFDIASRDYMMLLRSGQESSSNMYQWMGNENRSSFSMWVLLTGRVSSPDMC